MASEGWSAATLLKTLAQNPAALSMLQSLLSGFGGREDARHAGTAEHEETEEAESGEEREDGEEFSLPGGDPLATAVSALPTPPPGHGHGKGRREVLLSLRPFLSERRCASIDRVLRALELYEVIEEGRR